MKNQISNIKNKNQNVKISKILICRFDFCCLNFTFDEQSEEHGW